MDEAASRDELRLEVEELRASRTRLVVAADAERRRIEKDIHDGAQQHLVAVAVNLQLARQLARSDPAATEALLDEIGGDVRDALANVRALAREVFPPLLLDRGLADALRAAASAAGVRTHVQTAGLARHAADVEATAYFCCVEALRDAARRATEGARATVRVWQDDEVLLFEIADDGAGAEVSELTNARDRLAAIGGHLSVIHEPGSSTRVCGRIPLT
jgi:signal transduction histidine kinase